jgi:SAM-dependent methyltransferase
VIGELYEHALAGWMRPDIERADGSRMPLAVEGWLHESPGDKSLLDRCDGPTLDIGSGPGRLTVALSERGIPALGIDITPYAVDLARSSGALVMLRDVFGRVPGTGRWKTVILADGNIGIGGDPAALLRRAGELLAPEGQALVELEPPGTPLRQEQVRLCYAGRASAWFPWAFVGTDQIEDVARDAGLGEVETWTVEGRWFASISCCRVVSEAAELSYEASLADVSAELDEPSTAELDEPSTAELDEPSEQAEVSDELGELSAELGQASAELGEPSAELGQASEPSSLAEASEPEVAALLRNAYRPARG